MPTPETAMKQAAQAATFRPCRDDRGNLVSCTGAVCCCDPFAACACIVLPPPQPGDPHASRLLAILNSGGDFNGGVHVVMLAAAIHPDETLTGMVVERDGNDVDVEVLARVRPGCRGTFSSPGEAPSVEGFRVFSPAGMVLTHNERWQAEQALIEAKADDIECARDAADEARGEE